MRKISAITRHRRAEQLAGGWSEAEDGYMIPPGWSRDPEGERTDGAEGNE